MGEQLSRAEQSAVGAVVYKPDCYEKLGLRGSHFRDPRLRVVYDAIGRLRKKGVSVDELTIADELGDQLDAAGGLAFLSGLALACPSADNAPAYADIIRDAWLARAVQGHAGELVEMAKHGARGVELLDSLRERTQGLMAKADPGDLPTLSQTIQGSLGALMGGTLEAGLPIGHGVEKVVPGGIPRDKVSIFFAEQGTFKTTMVNDLKFSMARAGHKVLDVSLEDTSNLTAFRYLAQLTGVPYGRLAVGVISDAERQKVNSLSPADWAPTSNILTADSLAPKMGEIVRKALQVQAQHGISAVVIDYIQLLEGGTTPEGLRESVQQAQALARMHGLAVILVSQSNRDNMHRTDPRPKLTDMFGSGAMKEMGKVIFGLFRPINHWHSVEEYLEHTRGMPAHVKASLSDETYSNVLELWVLKNVMGAANKCKVLHVDEPTGRISEFGRLY